ncbi:MAG: hypothetical protein EZS28_019747, partial [Streblomastix strix]
MNGLTQDDQESGDETEGGFDLRYDLNIGVVENREFQDGGFFWMSYK